MVEHDEDAIRAADHIIDIGPGAGVHGGHVIAQGTHDDILAKILSPVSISLVKRKSKYRRLAIKPTTNGLSYLVPQVTT